jgi:hypothetical protein
MRPYCLLLRFDSAGPCCVLLRDDERLEAGEGARYRFVAATETWAEADAIRVSLEQQIREDNAVVSPMSSVVTVSR